MARHRNRSVFGQGGSTGLGRRLTRGLLILLAVGLVGGAVFLGFWDMPAPTETVVKEVHLDDRLPR